MLDSFYLLKKENLAQFCKQRPLNSVLLNNLVILYLTSNSRQLYMVPLLALVDLSGGDSSKDPLLLQW